MGDYAREPALFLRARDLIREGQLPSRVPKQGLARIRGTGDCSLCNRPIKYYEAGYECRRQNGEGDQIFRFHLLCCEIWQLECERL